MGWLMAGVVLWSAAHLFPGIAGAIRSKLIERLGRGGYRGIFALLIVTSIVCMVFGWRAATATVLYTPAAEFRLLTAALMVLALILFFSARLPTDIKRVLRHPQLTGVLTWALAHLLSNGDSRSLLLFGGLGAWAIAEMVAINRRDGAWVPPAAVGARRSAIPVVVGVAAWFLFAFLHPWIAGVSVIANP